MTLKMNQLIIPGLATCCAIGAVGVVVSARAPMEHELAMDDEVSYDLSIPNTIEPNSNLPSMEQVVEKHLFVKERKATGQNTFSDLVVKGVYLGDESSAVFSLKNRSDANLRVWKGDVDSVIRSITNPRDSRKPIVDFLSEWDIKEITFEGVVFEHIITGEVETYLVDYTPAKHVKDNAEAGYGQGQLAVTEQGGTSNAGSNTSSQRTQQSSAREQRAQAFQQMRSMVENMSPEQRSRLAERISEGFQPPGESRQNENSSNRESSSAASERGGGGSDSGGGRGRR
ncbi:hypothetical protein P4C99_12675 [Pontiellaceae bacterium B1224]|nr:hypothetical protein [Pontiellaceae bacterium B1224]